MSVVPSLQLLALLAVHPECIVQAISRFVEESSSSSSDSTEEEERAANRRKVRKDILRRILTFSKKLRYAVAEEADSRRAVGDEEEYFYPIGEPAWIADCHVVSSLAKLLPKTCDFDYCSDDLLLEEEEWTRQQMKLIRRNLIGRTGIIVGQDDDGQDDDNGQQIPIANPRSRKYVVVAPPYVPFALKGYCLEPLCDVGEGGFLADTNDTESCYDCCRTFPSQVEMLYAVHKNHGLLLCRDCMLQERSPRGCCLYECNRNRSDGCLNGIANLLEDLAMQDMLVNRHVKKGGEFTYELGCMAYYGRFLYDAIAGSELSFTVAGLSWDLLVSWVTFSRRLDNAVYFRFPGMRPKQPYSCKNCRKTSPGMSTFWHPCEVCNWPIFLVCSGCKITICYKCLQAKENKKRRCDTCSGDFVYPKERGEYNFNGFMPIN